MSGYLILGAGGHGKVVADILRCQGKAILGFLDDDPATWGSICFGLPVLGGIDAYADLAPDSLILGIGSNVARQAAAERLGTSVSSLWGNAIHPRSIIAESVQLGQGVVIAAGAIVNPDTTIGDHVIINTGATVDHDCTVGNCTHIAPGAHIAGGVRIGTGALIGIGASIIPHRTVGNWTVIGAGAVVINNIPDRVVAMGVPARWQHCTT